jgi:hypothetical protein
VLFAVVVCRAHPMSNEFSTALLTARKPLARAMRERMSAIHPQGHAEGSWSSAGS